MNWFKNITVVEVLVIVAMLVFVVIGIMYVGSLKGWMNKPLTGVTMGDLFNVTFVAAMLAGILTRK